MAVCLSSILFPVEPLIPWRLGNKRMSPIAFLSFPEAGAKNPEELILGVEARLRIWMRTSTSFLVCVMAGGRTRPSGFLTRIVDITHISLERLAQEKQHSSGI